MKKISVFILLLLTSLACSLSATVDENSDVPKQSIVNTERPTVVLLAPQTGNQYAVGVDILLHAEARDLGTGVARIEFYDSFDAMIGTVNAQNPQGDSRLSGTVTWRVPSAQSHLLSARAFRADNTQSGLAEIVIEAVNVNNAPIIPAVSNLNVTQPPNPQPAATTQTDQSSTTQPTPTTSSSQPTPTTLPALNATIINANSLNIRVGPNVNSDIVNVIQRGTTLQIVGRNDDNLWYATPLPNGSYGWVFGQYLDFDGDPSTLPLVATP